MAPVVGAECQAYDPGGVAAEGEDLVAGGHVSEIAGQLDNGPAHPDVES